MEGGPNPTTQWMVGGVEKNETKTRISGWKITGFLVGFRWFPEMETNRNLKTKHTNYISDIEKKYGKVSDIAFFVKSKKKQSSPENYQLSSENQWLEDDSFQFEMVPLLGKNSSIFRGYHFYHQ